MNRWQSRLAQRVPFYYGWVVFGSAVSVAFSSRALMAVATLSVFVVPMTEHFGWSRGLFSGAISLGGVCAIVISPFAGRLIDRYGSAAVVAAASAIAGACAVGLSLVGQPWAFYSLYVPGRAVFAGPLELGTATAISNWFIRRRPFAFAALSVWQGAGLALMPLATQFIIGVWGWRTAWGSLGVYTLAIGVLPASLLMARRPEDLGLEADPAVEARPPLGITESGLTGPPPASPVEVNFTVHEALRTRAFWLLALFSAAGFIVQAGVSLHQVPHFLQQGLSGPAAALTASTFAISQTVGGILVATLARRIPLRVLLSVVGFTAAVGSIGTGASTTLGWGMLAAVALGLAIGGLHLLLRLTYADYYGRLHLGSIRGLTIGAQIAGQVIGPVVAGFMFDTTGDYQLPFLLFTLIVSFGAVLVLAAKPPSKKLEAA